MTAIGNRVELVRCSDPYTRLEAGDRGTIGFVDDVGTVHVRWDSGSYLGMVPGEDVYRVLGPGEVAAEVAARAVLASQRRR